MRCDWLIYGGLVVFLNWRGCLPRNFHHLSRPWRLLAVQGLGCQAGREIKHLLSAPKSRWLLKWGKKGITHVMTSGKKSCR